MIRNSSGQPDRRWAVATVGQHIAISHRDLDEMLHRLHGPERQRGGRPRELPKDWKQDAQAAMYRGRILSLERSHRALTRKIEVLSGQVEKLAECLKDHQAQPIVLPVSTFAPEPYEILGPVNVVLRQDNGSFVASFAEANVNASGHNLNDALEMVKDMVLSTFDWLNDTSDDELGPGPLRQKQVLSTLIRRIDQR